MLRRQESHVRLRIGAQYSNFSIDGLDDRWNLRDRKELLDYHGFHAIMAIYQKVVFLSSTSKDLAVHREAAAQAARQVLGISMKRTSELPDVIATTLRRVIRISGFVALGKYTLEM
jgi:hypothetical protein